MKYVTLLGQMKENKITVAEMARELHIARSTFYRKANNTNGNDFTCKEMIIMCKKLNISSDIILADFC